MARKKTSDPLPAVKKQKQKKVVDPVQVFAEKVRDHKGLESRWAVLQDTRIEYFKGKDFVSLLQTHTDLRPSLSSLTPTAAANTSVGGNSAVSNNHSNHNNGVGFIESEEDLGNLLLKRKLILRCDRVLKTPRPGKTKLSKWPARLELYPDQTFSVDDAFFAWTFERRRPLWQTVLSFFVPIITLACCLFPVFPHPCKLVVLYTCLTFLSTILSILFLRFAIFGVIWVLLGKRIWFFPNILAEEASFKELLRFWPEPNKEDEKPPKWTSRLAFALVLGLVTWFCVHYAPDEAARTRYQKKVSNIIDDVLEWSPKLALSGKQAEVPIAQNDTNMNVTSDSGVEESSPLGVSNDASLPEELNADAHEIPDKVDGAE